MENTRLKVTKIDEGKELANEGKASLRTVAVVGLSAIIIVSAISIGVTAHKNHVNRANLENNVVSENVVESVEYTDGVEAEEVVVDETPVEDTEFSVAASFVDNHNQELYIFGAEEARNIDNQQTNTNNNNRNSNSNNGNRNTNNSGNSNTNNNSNSSSNNTNNNNTQPEEQNALSQFGQPNNGVIVTGGENVSVTQTNNTVINNNSGYQDDFQINQTNTNPITTNPSSQEAPSTAPNQISIPEPIDGGVIYQQEDLVYEGYVLRKQNYSENGMWYTFYEQNGVIYASCEDLSMLDASNLSQNSNIYGISDTRDVAGWTYVGQNSAEYCHLGRVSDYEATCRSLAASYAEAIANGNFEVEPGTEYRR